MECSECEVEKLSNEFPDVLSADCQHVMARCLKCLYPHAKRALEALESGEGVGRPGTCPDCDGDVLASAWREAVRRYEDLSGVTLEREVARLMSGASEGAAAAAGAAGGAAAAPAGHLVSFTVARMDGTTVSVDDVPLSSTIGEVAEAVCARTRGVKPSRTRLFYNGKELLRTHPQTGAVMRLGDSGVPAAGGFRLQMLVTMLDIASGSDLRKIVLDLSWGFPETGQDFLDASCIFVEQEDGEQCWRVVDYEHTHWATGIVHSGDMVTESRGSHRIVLDLDAVPATYDHFFFTLSAWNSPTIGHFPGPRLTIFDERRPEDELARYELARVRGSQAVVMCRFDRVAGGGWRATQVGRASAGNAMNYSPLYSTLNGQLRLNV